MRRCAARVACTLLLGLAGPVSVALAQGGTISGRVADSTGAAVARAALSVEGTTLRATSDEQGRYALRGVPAGAWTVRARLVGFVPGAQRVTVTPGATVTQDFVLVPQPIGLAAIDVVVGSRARHSAAEELAVPVDVFTAEDIATQGTREVGAMLAQMTPSVNFPRQSVTDATDVVRPFTLRGLSPDHTLVLVNGWRRHNTAVVNTFAYGTGAGSSGVDLNTIPASAIERIEVLRDGASAQYGSDAIAGVVNIVTREGPFAPMLSVDYGRYMTADYPGDGRTVDVNGGIGLALGRGSLSLFAEVLDRQPTNRAWPDAGDDGGTGVFDSIVNGQLIQKRNNIPQPNHHWGDGLERDILTMANLRMPLNDERTREVYAFGGYSNRLGNGNGYKRYTTSGRNWAQLYPLGFLPEFRPDVNDLSFTGGYRGTAGPWAVDAGVTYGRSTFVYNLRNTLNSSLGPCLATACAPGADGIAGNADDPGIPNQTSFRAGELGRGELAAGLTATRTLRGLLSNPVNLAVGVTFRRESYQITRGELASYINGGHLPQDSAGDDGVFGDDPGTAGTDESADDATDPRPGSQVFSGFTPDDEADASRTNIGAYVDLETNFTRALLANVAARFERYSDFGSLVTGKAALRFQASPQLTLRAAGSTGFRAPGLGQIHFSKIVTNVIAGQPVEVGVYPVDHPAAVLLGARPLQEETSFNLSGGVAFTPMPNLTFTADVFSVTINDRILLGATFDDDTTLARLAAGGFGDVGGVQYFTNGLDTRTRGLDLTADLRVPSATGGTFDFSAAINWTRNTITRVDPLPSQLANSSEPGLIDSVTYIGITEERPDMRATLTARYSRGALRGLVRSSYYGKFSSAQPGYCDLCRERYGAKTLFDVEVGYRIGRVNLSLGARNLLDTYPDQPSSQVDVDGGPTPAMLYNNNFGTFPWAAASPFGFNGRFVYVRFETLLSR